MASGLGEVAGGDMRAVFVAMAAAVLFGTVHAMMPGHGKTVLVSYHLGQPGKLRAGIANPAILTLTHSGSLLSWCSPRASTFETDEHLQACTPLRSAFTSKRTRTLVSGYAVVASGYRVSSSIRRSRISCSGPKEPHEIFQFIGCRI
jgi:hypothetical protein